MIGPMTIAVDFDDTIAEHQFPTIGNELPFATHTLKTLQEKGHRLILWTYRCGEQLDEAISFCTERGVEFYAINRNYPEEKMNDQISRKILADLCIDDGNIGGMPSWTDIFQRIHPEAAPKDQPKESKWKWWKQD